MTLGDPNYPKPSHFVSLFISSWWVEIEASNLFGRLVVESPSLWMTKQNITERCEVQGHRKAKLI